MSRHFTDEQMAVIRHGEGHAIVSAVAGSGKTESLLGRIEHLLSSHDPERIGAFMFGRDAASSFRERYRRMVGTEGPQIRTFNSAGNRLIQYLSAKEILPRFKIEPRESVRLRLARECFNETFKRREGGKVKPPDDLFDGFVAFLSLVKTDYRPAQVVFDEGKYQPIAAFFPAAFELMEQRRKAASLVFLEDQVRDPVLLMRQREDVVAMVTNRLDHLICDEAQDMNRVQIELVRFLAGDRAQIMLVGDEDQAIYQWRGGTADFMTRGFVRQYGRAERYTLSRTFRYGHRLSLAANHLIANNTDRPQKLCLSHSSTPDTQVVTLPHDLPSKPGETLVRQAQESGLGLNDIAILVRYYAHAVSLQLDLLAARIPHHVYGRAPLRRIPELSALLGLLQLSAGIWKDNADPKEREATIKSLLTIPTLYLTTDQIKQVIDRMGEEPSSLSTAVRSIITADMDPRQVQAVRDRADLLELVAQSDAGTTPAIELLELYLAGTQFDKAILAQSDSSAKATEINANVASLLEQARTHGGSVLAFLDHLDPLFDTVQIDPPDEPHVWISSIHKAKGMDWPQVIVPAWGNGVFPARHDEELEDERRLAYVAITRAKQKVYLLHPPDEGFDEAMSSPDFDPALENKDGAVSMFLWEMNLPVGQAAAQLLAQFPDQEGAVPEPVKAARPQVANQYLAALGRNDLAVFKLGTARATAPAGHIIQGVPNPQILPVNSRVRVEPWGAGRILEWITPSVIKVRLDSDADTRMFDVRKMSIKRL